MSHSVSRIRPGSPLQSKSNNSVFLFALHMHFPNIHIWTISFDLFSCFSIRGVCCCSHSLQAGEGVFWNCHCWGRPCYKSHGLHEFYHNEIPLALTLHARLPFLFQAVWGFLRQQACRQSWLCGRDDLIRTPHSCRGKLCAPRSKQQLSGEFICSHMNSKSAFSISKLQRGFALWEMPKCEVCISLLGMRHKMHNPSNKDMSETA